MKKCHWWTIKGFALLILFYFFTINTNIEHWNYFLCLSNNSNTYLILADVCFLRATDQASQLGGSIWAQLQRALQSHLYIHFLHFSSNLMAFCTVVYHRQEDGGSVKRSTMSTVTGQSRRGTSHSNCKRKRWCIFCTQANWRRPVVNCRTNAGTGHTATDRKLAVYKCCHPKVQFGPKPAFPPITHNKLMHSKVSYSKNGSWVDLGLNKITSFFVCYIRRN